MLPRYIYLPQKSGKKIKKVFHASRDQTARTTEIQTANYGIPHLFEPHLIF